MKYLTLVICILLSSCDYGPISPPERVQGIPKDAVWAGGQDGGSWFLCIKVKKFRYHCRIYNENSGKLLAKGDYLHKHVYWNKKKQKAVISSLNADKSLSPYAFYDGDNINLDNNEILVPDGWIIHPLDERHGKKQLYNNGMAIGEEVGY